MPRRNARREPRPRVPLGGYGAARREGSWLVRTVPGVHARKTYRCPGCDHEIRPGTAHVVAWPADGLDAAADRRHWHTGCWRSGPRRY